MATRVRSFSKVNLGLRIGPVRGDGFHTLATMYQTLALHDVVTVRARPAAYVGIALTTDHPRVPVDGRNTVWQMVERALRAMGKTAEVEVHIEKRLPIQGGMGAGSANAAAALLGLERELGAWEQGGRWMRGPERLRVAAEVGSDVPLFLVGGAVLGTGRGELVAPLPDVTLAHGGGGVACVVALPGVGVSTPAAFRDWDAREAVESGPGFAGEAGELEAGAEAELTAAEPTDRLDELSLAYSSAYAFSAGWTGEPEASGIAGGQSPSGRPGVKGHGAHDDQAGSTLLALVRTGIENDFEEVVFPHHPSLREIKRQLMGIGTEQPATYAALSGSGSALFGLYGSEEAARAAQQRVQGLGTEAILTETLGRSEYWARMFADVG